MMSCTDGTITYAESPGVKYTAPKGGNQPNIQIFTTASSTSAWNPPALQGGQIMSITFVKYQGGDDFDFSAITFWVKGTNGKLITQVSQTFNRGSGQSTTLTGVGTACNIDTDSPSQISCRIENAATSKSYVAFEITIQDAAKPNLYFTTADPQIELEKQSGPDTRPGQ
jgi:hypothetical protein